MDYGIETTGCVLIVTGIALARFLPEVAIAIIVLEAAGILLLVGSQP